MYAHASCHVFAQVPVPLLSLLSFTCGFAMTSSVADVLLELADITQILQSPHMSSRAKENLVQGLAAKIIAMQSPDTAGTAQLMQALVASNLDTLHVQVLQAAIDDRLTSRRPKSAFDNKCQLLTLPTNFLTEADWLRIDAPNSSPASMQRVVAERLARLGLRNLHEQTVKWAITIVVVKVLERTYRGPKHTTIFQWVLDFKRDYVSLKTPYTLARLATYPTDPANLPLAVREAAYDADDPPVSRALTNYQAVSEHVPLRKNSDQLVRERRALVDAPLDFDNDAQLTFGQLRAYMARANASQDLRRDPILDLHVLSPRKPLALMPDERSVGALAVRERDLEGDSAAGEMAAPQRSQSHDAFQIKPWGLRSELPSETPTAVSADAVSVRSLEDAAFHKLGNRLQKKTAGCQVADHGGPWAVIGNGNSDDASADYPPKPKSAMAAPPMKAAKASPKSVAKARSMTVVKKPAGLTKPTAPKTVAKKFDKAALHKHFRFPPLTKADKKLTTMKNYQSKAYHGCLCAARKCGFTDADAKVHVKRAFSKATSAWHGV